MNCIYTRKRSKNYKAYLYCTKYKKEIQLNDCKNCIDKEYKKRKPIKKVSKIPIKQRTSKQAKLERDRFSIFTDDLDACYICKNKKDDLHEIFMGAKRLTSIRYGLVLPLCRLHHLEMHNNTGIRLKWHVLGQSVAMEYYNWDIDKFIEIFGRNYL